MSPTSDISVVIAAFNAAGTVRAAIQSALAQEPCPEVVVVDDGSSDGTWDAVNSFGPQVRTIQQPNRGPSAARNAGLALATGAFIHFLDADDELAPGALSRLRSVFPLYPGAAAVSGAYLLNEAGTLARKPAAGAVLSKGQQHGEVEHFFDVWRREPIAWTGAVLSRTALVHDLGGFKEHMRFGEDVDLWARLAGRGSWVFVDEVVATYNHRASSITLSTPASAKTVGNIGERQLQIELPPALHASYRRFRRDRAIKQARALLHDANPRGARCVLRDALPCEPSMRLMTTALASLLPRRASKAVLMLLRATGRLRSRK